MTGILLLDSYFVTPISKPIVTITAANCRYIDFCSNNTCLFLSLLQCGLFVIAFIKPILCLCYVMFSVTNAEGYGYG